MSPAKKIIIVGLVCFTFRALFSSHNPSQSSRITAKTARKDNLDVSDCRALYMFGLSINPLFATRISAKTGQTCGGGRLIV
jgi:hypothetical protein